jgi:hypothetical protein
MEKNGGCIMRNSNKANMIHTGLQPLVSLDFHRFTEKEQTLNSMELAEEFGLSLHEVKNLRRKLNR